MDDVLFTAITASATLILIYMLRNKLDFNQATDYVQCLDCSHQIQDPIILENCGHNLCKKCVDLRLRESNLTWFDLDRKAYKFWCCPKCKEPYRLGGRKLF